MRTAPSSEQRHQSGLMLITTGWPSGLSPEQRQYMLGWMISQLPEARAFLTNRGLLKDDMDHSALPPAFWFNILTIDPTTVPQGQGFYSTMTMLTFKAWDLRSAFLSRYGGSSGTPLYSAPTTPQVGKHIRVSPCAPQWQRKLEAPLRVLIAVCNSRPDCADKRLTILWKSLTLMAPTETPDFDHDAVAWGRLFYEESNGSFKGRLEVCPDLLRIMMSGPVDHSAKEESLWSEKWNEIIWGTQLTMDQMDQAAYQAAKQQGKGSGKGTQYGGGRRHWSNMLLHNSHFSPFPFELEIAQVEAVAYIWDEFCTKSGQPGECVGDIRACTYQGKPLLPNDGDEEMHGTTTPSQSQMPYSKASAPKPPTAGGKGAKGS